MVPEGVVVGRPRRRRRGTSHRPGRVPGDGRCWPVPPRSWLRARRWSGWSTAGLEGGRRRPPAPRPRSSWTRAAASRCARPTRSAACGAPPTLDQLRVPQLPAPLDGALVTAAYTGPDRQDGLLLTANWAGAVEGGPEEAAKHWAGGAFLDQPPTFESFPRDDLDVRCTRTLAGAGPEAGPYATWTAPPRSGHDRLPDRLAHGQPARRGAPQAPRLTPAPAGGRLSRRRAGAVPPGRSPRRR